MELRLSECSAESSRVTWSYATMYWGVSLYMAAHTISCLKWNIWVSSVLFECNDFWSKYSTRKFDKRVLTILLLKIVVAIFDLYRSWRQVRKTFAPRGWATVKEKKRGGVGAMAYVHNYWQNRGDMTQEGIDANHTSLVSGNTLAKNQIWFGWERNTVEFIIFLVTWCSKAGEFFLSSPFHSCELGCRAFLQEWG